MSRFEKSEGLLNLPAEQFNTLRDTVISSIMDIETAAYDAVTSIYNEIVEDNTQYLIIEPSPSSSYYSEGVSNVLMSEKFGFSSSDAFDITERLLQGLHKYNIPNKPLKESWFKTTVDTLIIKDRFGVELIQFSPENNRVKWAVKGNRAVEDFTDSSFSGLPFNEAVKAIDWPDDPDYGGTESYISEFYTDNIPDIIYYGQYGPANNNEDTGSSPR